MTNAAIAAQMKSSPSLDTHLETVKCDLCQSTRASLYLRVRDRIYDLPGEFELVRCEKCGLLYISPRPDRASMGAFYPGLDYHAFKQSGGLKARIINRMRQNEARGLLKGLPAHAHVLEIGCATGEMLVALRDLGAEVMGIEPSPEAAEWACEKHNLLVEKGILDDFHFADAQFDLILMRYTLEHVHSPRQNLAEIERLLKPGGRAILWVPNAASLDARLFGKYWRGLDAPRHLFIFTPDTMRQFVESAGLTVQAIGYSGVPNDWAGSFEAMLKDRGLPSGLTKWFGVESPLALAAWLPVSTAAALFRAGGRIRVTAVK